MIIRVKKGSDCLTVAQNGFRMLELPHVVEPNKQNSTFQVKCVLNTFSVSGIMTGNAEWGGLCPHWAKKFLKSDQGEGWSLTPKFQVAKIFSWNNSEK